MLKNELLLNIYLMRDRKGCLVLKGTGKPYKIFNLEGVLPFVGQLKQLSLAIDTGANQNCGFCMPDVDGMERLLKCKFVRDIVALEIWVKHQLKFSWNGTAKEFKAAVDRLISRLPKFI